MATPARVVLLGTAGGSITWAPGTGGAVARFGISTAIVVGDRIYIVDTGAGSTRQLTLADPFARGAGAVLSDLGGFFITHLHSDHTVDLANYVLCASNQGWPKDPVPVFGPWSRQLRDDEEHVAEQLHIRDHTIPGIQHLVAHLAEGFISDAQDRMISAHSAPFEELVRARDITPPMNPTQQTFRVFEDERIQVTSAIVSHGTMAPALAYRFDTGEGTVVLSGDTGPCDNLVELACGADVLIHEAISYRFATATYGEPPYTPEQRSKLDHVFAKHTSSALVGEIAAKAEVRKLVLSHLVPGNAPDADWLVGASAFDGEFVVGRDLMEIPIVAR
ncbi:MBL fold metallo-hydrolase [Changpingibacter yushuensis]|jgi:ribonuclease BN (tRNA processing enzyme)|uniref:MBL fold metallo-hydrolase n=1 Tax=Changpingibacter yushuensis TaxID=2758440 RepID=UPI00165EAA41|nr:MBL fold metallo-hydrolase [Changpingibacter yushuensis]